MKIPLAVRMHSEGLKPFVAAHLKIPEQKVRGSTVRGLISPFVDTGSPFTIISQTDAERLRIRVSGNPRRIWLGGAPLHNYELKGVELKVAYEDKKTFCDISIPTVGVALPIPNDANSIKTSKAVPSIIGTDILLHHRLAIYFDICHKISYLEKVQ